MASMVPHVILDTRVIIRSRIFLTFHFRYNKTTSQYELTVQRETTIEVVPDDGDLPKVKFDFKTIADIEAIEVGEILDVVGKKGAWGQLFDATRVG